MNLTDGKRREFNGALAHAHQEILDAYANEEACVYSSTHDLAMVVHCIFHRVCPVTYACLLRNHHKTKREKMKWIQAFRETHMKGEPWSLLFTAAENNQYNELRKLVVKLALPGCPKVLGSKVAF